MLADLCAVSTCCQIWARVGWDELLWKSLFLRHFDLPSSAAMPEDADSWRLEFRRLYEDTPCIEAVKLTAHTDEVLHVAFSQDGSRFASCSKDCSVKVWDGHSYELLHSEDLHNRNWLYSQFSQFSQDGLRLLVSGAKNSPFEMSSGSILIFSLDGFSLLAAAYAEPYDIFGCWFGREAFLSGNIEDFSIFRLSVHFALEKFSYMQRRLLHFRLFNNSYPRMLAIARAHTGEEETMLETDDDYGNKLLIFATGSLTYASHQIGIKFLPAEVFRTLIKLPRVDEGLLERETDGHEDVEEADLEAVEDWPDFQGNVDGPTSLDCLLEFNGQIVGFCLSPDHRYLFVNCRAWAPDTQIPDPTHPPPISNIITLHEVDLWSLERGNHVRISEKTEFRRFLGHKAFTPEDRCFFMFMDASHSLLSSGSEDASAYVWDRHYGACVATLLHHDVVNSVALHPTRHGVLVSASDDHILRVWHPRSLSRHDG
uniref:F-box/WD repeat-containing protein 5-like isoform X2 n=1 Tax=Myxine glutinosa TaxID=7769 RepID=UPI00358E5F5C